MAALLLPATAAQAAETYPAPVSGAWTLTGQGYGHGYGLSQWGAQSRALAGQDYRRILGDYYPGTTVGDRDDRGLRVQITRVSGSEVYLHSAGAAPLRVGERTVPQSQRVQVKFENGALQLTAWEPGWRLVWSDRWTSVPTISGDDGIWIERADGSGNRYRGTVSIPLTERITPVNNVSLEEYLLGVVPRESPSWFAGEALKAQAVAARSYALSTLRPASSPYDLCDSESCQVYGGVQQRASNGAIQELQPASTTAAVRATAGEIREYAGAPAFTQFSSSNGGFMATGSKPYLRAGEDYWSSPAGKVSQDTVAGWTAQLPVATVARNCPAGGALRSMTVTARDGSGPWGGRVTGLFLRCSTGDRALSGPSVARFGGALRSSLWNVVPGGSAQIASTWQRLGAAEGVLGAPTTPIFALPQVEGSYQRFEEGNVYWSPRSGASAVRGAILGKWAALGYENSVLGFPTTNEGPVTKGGIGQQFLNGSIYFSPRTGAHEVHGSIRQKWISLGWEAGYLGLPTTDEIRLRAGAFSAFEGGSIYFSPASGTHVVRGAIRDAWGRVGWENGRLGYPTSDEYDVPGGKRSDFQGGAITWTPGGGAVVTYR